MTFDIRFNKLEMDSTYTPVQDWDVANKKFVVDSILISVGAVVPIGAIIAVSGTFSAGNNGGTYSESGVSIGEPWKLCDGSQIVDAASPFNLRYVPMITDDRFLRGCSSGGTGGGSQTRTPNTAFAATVGIGTSTAGKYKPAGTSNHDHGLAAAVAVIGWIGSDTRIYFKSRSSGQPVDQYFPVSGQAANGGTNLQTATALSGNTDTVSANFVGTEVDIGQWFLPTPVNIEPLYLNVKYYQRIK